MMDLNRCKECDKCKVLLEGMTIFKTAKEHFTDYNVTFPRNPDAMYCLYYKNDLKRIGGYDEYYREMEACPEIEKLVNIAEAQKHKCRLKKEVCFKCICGHAAKCRDLEVGFFKGFWNGWEPHEIENAFEDWWKEGEIICPFEDGWCQINDEVIGIQNRSIHKTRYPAPDSCPHKAEHRNDDDDAYLATIAAKDDFYGLSKDKCKKCMEMHGCEWDDGKKYYRRSYDIMWDEGYLACIHMHGEFEQVCLEEARDKCCPFMDDDDGSKMAASGVERAERLAKDAKKYEEMMAKIKAENEKTEEC